MKTETPLKWPSGWQKEPEMKRFYSWSNLKISLVHLEQVMSSLTAKDVIVTHNVGGKEISIFFTLYNKRLCIASDKWDRKEDNITAISMFLETLLKSKKYIGENIILYCLSNLKENPNTLKTIISNIKKPLWCNVLDLNEDCTKEEVKQQFHILCKTAHPDNGGTTDEFILLKQAYDEGMKYAR